MPAKLAPSERAIAGSETETMLASRCSMKDGAEVAISTSIGCFAESGDIVEMASFMGRPRLAGILRLSVAEGPVLLLDLDKIDQDVLGPDARRPGEPLGDCLVELLLLLDHPALVPSDLDDHEVVGPMDAEIVRIEQ